MVAEGVVRGEGVEAQSAEPARHSGALHDVTVGAGSAEERVEDIIGNIGTRALLAADTFVEVELSSDLRYVDLSLLLHCLQHLIQRTHRAEDTRPTVIVGISLDTVRGTS